MNAHPKAEWGMGRNIKSQSTGETRFIQYQVWIKGTAHGLTLELRRIIRCWIISRGVESRQHRFYQIVVLNNETMLDPFTIFVLNAHLCPLCPPSKSNINDCHILTDLFWGCSNQCRPPTKRAVILLWRGKAITYIYKYIFVEWKMHELHDTTNVWKNKSNLFDIIRPFVFRRRAFAEHEPPTVLCVIQFHNHKQMNKCVQQA